MTRRTLRDALAGRGFMLLPAAAFAVHQLRYELAYGNGSSQALTAQGHGYLNSLGPWVVLLLALALGSFLARVARAAAGRPDTRPRRGLARLWLLAWASLLVAYSAQEWLEGALAAGHPGGITGVFGHGGVWAVGLSALAALVVALLLQAASVAVEVVSRLCSVRRPASRSLSFPSFSQVVVPRCSPLAGNLAGRAPPRTCCATA